MSSEAATAGASYSARALPVHDAEVPAGVHAPAAARSAVAGWLAGRVSERVLDDALLLVSELVSNSLQHARLAADTPLRVSAALLPGVVRIEVGDPGSAGRVVGRTPDPGNGGGYGLHLVELLTTRWGVDRSSGTRVWFELAAREA